MIWGGLNIKYIIYKITNKVNNKFYIGITSKTLKHRWNGHCRKARHKPTTNFHQAINKYGEDSWGKEVLYQFETTNKKQAYRIEQIFIDEYEAYSKGYNMDIGFGWNIADRRGANNPMYGEISGNASPVVAGGKKYSSVTAASKALNRNRNTVASWCKSGKYEDYYYIT